MADEVENLLEQLQTLTPMPDDQVATAEVIDHYDYIVERLTEFKDPRCIQPLIESFGYIDGFGVYWRALHLLEDFGTEQITPFLLAALSHNNRGTKYWATFMLMRIRNNEAIPQLIKLTGDEAEYVRSEAALALSVLGGVAMKPHLEKLRDDPSEEVRSTIEHIFAEWNRIDS